MELKIMMYIIQFLFLILVFGQDNLRSKSACLGNCLTCNIDELSKCSGEQYIGCVKGYSGASCAVKDNYGNQIILFDSQSQKIPIGWKNGNIFTCFYNNSQNQETKVNVLGIYLQFDSNQVSIQVQPWFQNYIINFNLIRDVWSPYSDLLRVVTFDSQQNQINQNFIEFLQRDTIDPNKNKLRCDNESFLVQKYQFEGILEQNLKKMILKFEGMMFSQAKWAISNIRITYGCSNFILYDGASCQACHKGYYPVRTSNNVLSRCNICPIACKQCKQFSTCVKCSQGFNLTNGSCTNNHPNLIYAVPQRNLSCKSNTLRLSKKQGSVEKIELSISIVEHTKIRVYFYLFYVISKQIQKGSIKVSINGQQQIQINGQQLYSKRYPNQKCKNFGTSEYYSIIRLDSQYFDDESSHIQMIILGENVQKFGLEEVFIEYQAKIVQQPSVSIAKFVENKQNTNNTAQVNQSRLLQQKKEDPKIQQQKEQKIKDQNLIQIKPSNQSLNSEPPAKQIQKKQQNYEQIKYSSIKVNHTEKIEQPQQTKVQLIKSQQVDSDDQVDIDQEKSEQIKTESIPVKPLENKYQSEKIVQNKQVQIKTQQEKGTKLKQQVQKNEQSTKQQNFSQNIKNMEQTSNKSQTNTNKSISISPNQNQNQTKSTTKQQIQTTIGINKLGTRIMNIQKILTVKQKIIIGVKYSEQLIITINYPVQLKEFPYIMGHLSKKNLTIIPKVSYQTTNYQELTFNIKQSLLDEIILLKMLSQNPIKTNQRLLQTGANSQLGKINVYRYDYLTLEERDQIKKFSIVFQVIAWFAIISSILLTFLASGVLVQQFVLTLQIIFMHLYLFSQYLPINFRLTLGGLKRIQNLNYFLTDAAAQIQSLLLGNVTQVSPQRFTMFKRDINFTRAIYPSIIIIFCYLIGFLLLKWIKKLLQPKLYQKKESINEKESNLKLFIIRVAQRSMSFWYQIWQYLYITFVWAGCLQLHNLSYPQGSNRYDLPNSMFCFLCLVLGLGFPIVTFLYLNRRKEELGYIKYCYMYENIFFMKLPDQKLASRLHPIEIIVKNLRFIIICVSIAFIGAWPLVALIILVLTNLFSIFFTTMSHIEVNKINQKLNIIEYLLLMFLESAILLAYGTSISLQKDTYLIIGYVLIALCLGLIFFALVRIFYYVYHKIFQVRIGDRVNFKHPEGTGAYF